MQLIVPKWFLISIEDSLPNNNLPGQGIAAFCHAEAQSMGYFDL